MFVRENYIFTLKYYSGILRDLLPKNPLLLFYSILHCLGIMVIKALLLAIGIVAILAVAIGPAMNFSVDAVKTEQDRECSQDTGNADLGEDCPGNSGDNNPNREQQECDVTAGSNDKRVEGQFKKEC
jgi:hypothetical protein